MTEPLPVGENWQIQAGLEVRLPYNSMLGMEGGETFALGRYRLPRTTVRSDRV